MTTEKILEGKVSIELGKWVRVGWGIGHSAKSLCALGPGFDLRSKRRKGLCIKE